MTRRTIELIESGCSECIVWLRSRSRQNGGLVTCGTAKDDFGLTCHESIVVSDPRHCAFSFNGYMTE